MEDEQRRKRMRRTTLDQLEEGRIFQGLETIESESNEGETNSDDEFLWGDDEFFFDAAQSRIDDLSEIEYDEYDYNTQDVEEDDIDPDELSYEELIALGEMVGVENTGLPEAEINKHLQPLTCPSVAVLLMDRCVICQVEFEEGEKLVTLHCDHLYHRDCIARWLQIKKICPICNNEVSSQEYSNTTE